MDVVYLFRDNVVEDFEGRTEKIGMRWNLKLETLTRNISVTDKSMPYVLLP